MSENDVKLVKQLSNYDITHVVGKELARVGQKSIMSFISKGSVDSVNELASLYSIKSTDKGLKILSTVKNKAPDAYSELMQVSAAAAYAAKQADLGLDEEPAARLTNRSGAKNVYKKQYEFKVITERELRNGEYSAEDGWKVLRDPVYKNGGATTIMGIVAREQEGYGIQTGTLSSISSANDGLYLDIGKKGSHPVYLDQNNAIPIGYNEYKDVRILLKKSELAKLEVETNPFDSLYRGLAHNQEVFEIKKLYRDVIEKKIYDITGKNDEIKLDKLLSKDRLGKNDKYPLFLKTNMAKYDRLPESIKKNYVKPPFISNVFQLDKRIDLVHKNFVDELSGYQRHSLVNRNNPKLYKAEKVWRSLVIMFKSHVVMGNPQKIAADSISNMSILSAYDVPITSMWKYGREAIKLNSEMTKLRNRLIDNRLQLSAAKQIGDEKAITKWTNKVIESAEAIKTHRFAPALNEGFIQSIGTDMMTKESDAISGLKSDMDSVLDKVLDHKALRKSLTWFATTGFSVEDLINFANKVTPKGSSVEKEIDRTVKKLRSIKKEKDMNAYIHQMFGTPGASEIIRHGGNMTLYIDVMSRWVVYKHQIDMGETPKKAAKQANDAFIDYRTNMPSELELLSATGAWMFPQFALRIQKVLYGLMTTRPVSTGMGVGGALATDSYGMHIFASNGFQKNINSIDGLDTNMVFPKEFWSL